MITLKETLEDIVNNNPFLEDSLYNSYLNLTSFAEYVKPQVENITKKEVSVSSIKMALSRISIKNQKKGYFRFDNTSFFLRKDINILNIKKTKENQKLVNDLYTKASEFEEEYLVVVQGIKEIDIVYSSKINDFIKKIIPQNKIELCLNNLSLIGLQVSPEVINIPGFFYNFSKKLYFFDINIIQVISTYKEFGIIVKNEDSKRAFEVIVG